MLKAFPPSRESLTVGPESNPFSGPFFVRIKKPARVVATLRHPAGLNKNVQRRQYFRNTGIVIMIPTSSSPSAPDSGTSFTGKVSTV